MEVPKDDSARMELLGRRLAGECSPEEEAAIAAWLAADPGHLATWEALKAIWEEAEAPAPGQEARTDAAWGRLRDRMHESAGGGEEERPVRPPARFPAWRVAAAVALLLGVGYLLWQFALRSPAPEMVHVASGALPRIDTLPDGTVVQLNAHSSIDYPSAFADGERVVTLQGEAFFEVAHDAQHPFRIHAGEADVRVLGTSFNLSTAGGRVRVSVLTGRVELGARDSVDAQPRPRMLLTAGMKGSYDAGTRQVQAEEGEAENAQHWRTGRLVFRDAPMDRVVADLNAAFDDSVALANPAVARCHLSTSFERASIDSVVAVITETLDLQVIHNGNLYLLDGKGCE